MLRYNNFKSGGWKPITFVVREHSSKTHTYWIFFLAASSDIITYISVFKPIKQWKGKQKFRCLMDLLIICLGTRKIMLQCITCRVQTSTLNISGKPTIVIIWIFYNMKNASVKVGGVAKIHTMLSLKKIYVFQSRKGNLFELPNSGIYFSIIIMLQILWIILFYFLMF